MERNYGDGETMVQYLQRVDEYVKALEDLNYKVDEKETIYTALQGLDQEANEALLQYLHLEQQKWTKAWIWEVLVSDEARKRDAGRGVEGGMGAGDRAASKKYQQRQGSGGKKKELDKCLVPGCNRKHSWKECWSRPNGWKPQGYPGEAPPVTRPEWVERRMKNGAWNKKGSKEKAAAAVANEDKKGKEDSSDDGFSFLSLEQETALAGRVLADPNQLILDSGATCGMVPRRDLFTTYHSLPPNSKNVIVGSGDTLQAIGIGTITVKGKEGERSKAWMLWSVADQRVVESRDVVFHEGLSYKGWKERGASTVGSSLQDPYTSSIFEGAWEDPGEEVQEQQEEQKAAAPHHEESPTAGSTPDPNAPAHDPEQQPPQQHTPPVPVGRWQQLLQQQLPKSPRSPMKRVTWREKLQSLEQGEASPLRRTTRIPRPPERFTRSAQYACMHDHEVHDLEECMLVDADGGAHGLDFCLMGQSFGLSEANPVRTPLPTGFDVHAHAEDPLLRNELVQLYQSIVGSLMYASTTTQPQIAYAVSQLSKVVYCPKAFHLQAAKRVLRYLKGCVKSGILYPAHSKPKVELVGFSDADYAGDSADRKSHTGYVYCLNGAAISWQSKRQPVVALSTTESEYISLCQCIQEGVWLKRLFGEFGHELAGGVPMFVDNQSAIALAQNACLHGHTKHMQVRWHFIREMVASSKVILRWCPTNRQAADILTKPLPFERHGVCMSLMGMQPHVGMVPEQDVGGLVLLCLDDIMLWTAPLPGQGGVE
ncbi:unnamed protein product [Closterium sp. NIES-54]